MIDLVHWLIGDISEVGSTLDCFLKRTHPQKERFVPANDTATLSIMLASGAVGTISTSAVSLIADKGQEQIVKIHGKDGTLECKYSGVGSDSAAGKVVTPFEIKGAKFGQQEFKTLAVPDETWGGADRLNMFLGLFTEPYGGRLFIDAILEDRTVSPSLLDGLKAQLVIDAAIESDKTRRWVKVQTIE